VANTGSPSIAIFQIGSSGSLTELTTPFSDGFSGPIAVTFDPTGKFLYVANNGSNNVEVYTIANGIPTALTTSTTSNAYSTESSPAFLAEDPNGKYLFVGNQGTSAGVQSFSISSSSTTLIPVFTYGVGNTPSSIVVLE
jgi:6-phosphogluconolactonase (cycloisomerase 2 family)